MVRVANGMQAGEGHACHEAAPQVGAQQVRDQRIQHQEDDHHQEEDLVLGQADPVQAGGQVVSLVRNHGQQTLINDRRPKLHGCDHSACHEGDANDRVDDRGDDVEVSAQAEEDVEEDQRQDVVHKGGSDDGLPEALLQHACLAQEPEGYADARGRERSAGSNAVWHEGLAESQHQQGAGGEGQDGPDDGDDARRDAHLTRLLEIKVHSALEYHKRHTSMADQREHVRRKAAMVRDVRLATLL
mmetsp:Transcript_48571/g.145045  ORF Transcript_48571/g.145045 Transcript_48571/m.145045 type:complete len:243 (+) Transcript_48571:802-1530(+)